MPPSRFLAAAPSLALALLVACAAKVQEPEPFIATPDSVTLEMLRAANVGPADHVIDLGSGDGRIVILAAKRFGATGLGVDSAPDLVERSIRNARDAGVSDKAAFKQQDPLETDLSPATVVTMDLRPEVNLKLRPALLALKPGTRIVSHDSDLGDWEPDQTAMVAAPDRQAGLNKAGTVHLWTVPVQVRGTWCGNGLLRGTALNLEQRYQQFEGTLTRGERSRNVDGRVEGTTLRTSRESSGRAGELLLEVQGDQMRIAAAGGPLTLAKGMSFRRVVGTGC